MAKVSFTSHEDDQIVQLKQENKTWRQIGQELHRSHHSVKSRHRRLVAERAKLTDVSGAQIVPPGPDGPALAPHPEKSDA